MLNLSPSNRRVALSYYVINSMKAGSNRLGQDSCQVKPQRGASLSFNHSPVSHNRSAGPRKHCQILSAVPGSGYTDSIGQALQIVGADQTIDYTSLKPVHTAALDAGQVIVGWTKQGMDGIEIWVDRGAGFAFLAVDTVPDYTDTQTPPAGQSTLWKIQDHLPPRRRPRRAVERCGQRRGGR